MNRIEFMRQLESLLHNISPTEKEEALQYYNDYFDDAGVENEQSVIEALGTPAKVAETIKKDLSGDGSADFSFQRDVPDDRAVVEYGDQRKTEAENVSVNNNPAGAQGSAGSNGMTGDSVQRSPFADLFGNSNTETQNPFGSTGNQNPFGSSGEQNIFGNTGSQNGFGGTGSQNGFGNTADQSSFGGTGSQNGFGNTADQSGFGGTGSQNGFGNTADQSGFGGTGSQNSFGNTGNQNGFGNTGNQSGYGNTGNQSGFGGGNFGSGYGGQAGAGNNTGYGNQAYGSYTNYDNSYNNRPVERGKKMSTGMIVLIVVLCVIFSPVAFSLITGAVSGLFGLIIGWFCMILGFGVAAAVLLIAGLVLAGFGVAGMFVSPLGGLGMIGGGLACAGFGILFLMLTVAMAGIATPAIFRGLGFLWHKLFGRKKRAVNGY